MNISANSQKPDSPKIYRIKANLTIIKLLHESIRPCFSVICWPREISFAAIMPPQRDFRAEKYLAVVHCKGGKAVRKSKLSVPLCYVLNLSNRPRQQPRLLKPLVQVNIQLVGPPHLHVSGFFGLFVKQGKDSYSMTWNDLQEVSTKKKHKFCKITRKLKAYRDKKARFAASWIAVRQDLVSALQR